MRVRRAGRLTANQGTRNGGRCGQGSRSTRENRTQMKLSGGINRLGFLRFRFRGSII